MPSFRKVQTKRGEVYWLVRVFVGRDSKGKQISIAKKSPSPSKKEAERLARELQAKHERGEVVAGKVTVDSLFDDLLLHFKVNNKSPWAEIVIKAHLRPFFGNMRADQVTTATAHRYIAMRQGKGKANGTINRELTMLRRAFRYATEVTPPKVGKVPRIPKLEEGPPRKGFFEFAEYEAMLAALPEEIKPVLRFAFATGCRRGEILALQWSQVDFLGGVIRLEPGTTKNKEGRTIPLSNDLVVMLKVQRQIRDSYHPKSPWVFFRHASGEPLKDFRGAWEGACKKCGLWDTAKEKPTRLLHDLRRTAIRDLTRSGVPERVAMAISGHKTREVFDRYDIVDEADLRHGINRREAYHEQLRRKAAEEVVPKLDQKGENNERAPS